MKRLDDSTRRLAVRVAVLVTCSIAAVPGLAAQDSLYRESRPAMGTAVEMLVYAPDRGRAAALFEAAYEEIERVEAALSNYRPTSEISRINATASERPVVTDPEVFSLLARALDYSRRTDGAFDITVGKLVRAWGFFRDRGHFPSPAELATARAAVGWQYVALDHTARTVHFLAPGLELDLGGIGKGFALDRASIRLRRAGVTAALLGAGQSSYAAIGAPPTTAGWPVVVPDPRDPERPLSTVLLCDRSLSTSGSGQKFFEYEGTKYSHLIDPRTGEPATGMRQATVTALTAADADALATAVFVAGSTEAARFLAQYDGVAALLVTEDGTDTSVATIGWPALLHRAIEVSGSAHER